MVNLRNYLGEGAHAGQKTDIWFIVRPIGGIHVGEGKIVAVEDTTVRVAGKTNRPLDYDFDVELTLTGPGTCRYTFRQPFAAVINGTYVVEGNELKTRFEYLGNEVEINLWRHDTTETGIWTKFFLLPLGARFHAAPKPAAGETPAQRDEVLYETA